MSDSPYGENDGDSGVTMSEKISKNIKSILIIQCLQRPGRKKEGVLENEDLAG